MRDSSLSLLISILVLFSLSTQQSIEDAGQQQSDQASDDQLYVHLVPHTHDDVGWLKTVDQYFTGSEDVTQRAGVELILDTVVHELLKDPKKRFTYVEMKFFSMWFYEQTETMKANVRGLVQEGRLEFVNGGWSMNDEACPHYEDILLNMMHGHAFLKKEFGVTPRIGWHLDPFGHSSANPRLFSDLGFDAWVFARLDYQDKEKRLSDKEMEFVWRPFYNHLGNSTQIFTHVSYNQYSAPPGFDFDTRAKEDPFVDDPFLETFNADSMCIKLLKYLEEMRSHYRTNHLFVLMGDDFEYQDSKMYYGSVDKLIAYFNAKYTNITLMYSTPSQYFKALNDLDAQWPTKYDDMYPYAEKENSYWTGYFTSRANDKEYIRRGSKNIHSASKLYGLAVLDQSHSQRVVDSILNLTNNFFDTMGINQHHDAVTGTAKQAVANDYAWRIFKSLQKNNQGYASLIDHEAFKQTGIHSNSSWEWCFRENSTFVDCPIADHYKRPGFKGMLVAVHNPSLRGQKQVKIATPPENFSASVFNEHTREFEEADSTMICDKGFTESLEELDNCWLYVNMHINASSIGFLKVEVSENNNNLAAESSSNSIENKQQKLTYISNDDGLIFNLTKKETDETFQFSFDLRYYASYQGDGQKSGAYIFRPENDTLDSSRYSFFGDEVHTYVGQEQAQMTFYFGRDSVLNESAVVRVRLVNDSPIMEWEVNLGGIPLSDQGKEVTVNFRSFDIDNNQTFYTDSNGLEMQERIFNYRPTWDFNTTQNISANFYPVGSAIAIKDTQKQLQMTVMNSRSQGGSSLRPGRIEIMHNRRMYYDDDKGVGEPLNETDKLGNGIQVPAIYHVQLFNYAKEDSRQREMQLKQDESPQYFFQFNFSQQGTPQTKKYFHTLPGLQTSQKVPIKYILFPLARDKIVLRLENIADKFDGHEAVVRLNLAQIAAELYSLANNGQQTSIPQINIEEVTLTANQQFEEMKEQKLKWRTVDDDGMHHGQKISLGVQEAKISLESQRIRQFIISYEHTSAFLQ